MGYIEITGSLNANGQKPAIIVSRFNEFITESLLKGAVDAFIRHGVSEKDITVIKIPGAYEFPFIASLLAKTKKYDSIVCLGAVIRGSTAHFDYVAGEAAKVGQIGKEFNLPVIFGVLTTNTIEEAIERSGTKAGNKGAEAAITAIEMSNIVKQI
ncbi:MAG: 6,7-dimethyl-8-ribityllumazine synthase [Leptospiraceae bacterium]|nr:6,7-dimethyl-8-ribityllumazine synthase [Leptospiraceae bacterium]MCK6380160.1 6,7-dimethyl-8-ribityllumazine synthase [Leptospiraceae bacterium]NUM41749.1 6,7-dimethyl-8-ribityllumazine synthase [Leptospiraceae bacterium]